MTKRKKQPAFSSIRIIGKKAQDLLAKARHDAGKHTPSKAKKRVAIPKEEEYAEIVAHISLISLVKAAFAILAIVAGVWMLNAIRDKIIMLLLGFFVASIMDPGVRALEHRGVPRGLGILIHYAIALIIFAFLLLSLIPIIATQLQQLAVFLGMQVDLFLSNPQISLPLVSADINTRLTDIAQGALQNLSINEFVDNLQQFAQNLSSFAQGSLLFATRVAQGIVGFFVQLAIVLVLAFFIQLEKEQIRRWTVSFFPDNYKHYIDTKAEMIQNKMGQWARGQLFLGICIAVLTFLALKILRMPYALTLSVLAGFTEFIPYIGPLIAAVPAILIGVTQGGILWGLILAAVYYIIQWCENNLLVPLIMNRAVGLSPIVIIFAMLIAVSFSDIIHPILGILIAVPVTTVISIFLSDLQNGKSGE